MVFSTSKIILPSGVFLVSSLYYWDSKQVGYSSLGARLYLKGYCSEQFCIINTVRGPNLNDQIQQDYKKNCVKYEQDEIYNKTVQDGSWHHM